MKSNKSVLILGSNGMVGGSIFRILQNKCDIDLYTPSRLELDLTNQNSVNNYFDANHFDEVYLAAAKVGGIHANNIYRADFIYENLIIQLNVIKACHAHNVGRLLFLGSSCIYPKFSTQPINENELLGGQLEHTNEPYAIAKIAGIKCCESYYYQYNSDFRCIMPTNLYGPYDNFHKENSHVIPALISRFHEAICNNSDSIKIWGSGSPKREFLHVDDMARACIHLMELSQDSYFSVYKDGISHINAGSSEEISIKELAFLISEITQFKGKIEFDKSKPDGTPRKLLDSSIIKSFGWSPNISLKDGLNETYNWYVKNLEKIRS